MTFQRNQTQQQSRNPSNSLKNKKSNSQNRKNIEDPMPDAVSVPSTNEYGQIQKIFPEST